MPERTRLAGRDWLELLLLCLTGVGVSALGLWLLLQTVLAPVLLQERGLRTNRNVRLVEKVLESTPLSQLPKGVIIDRSADGPGIPADDLRRFDPQFVDYLHERYALRRAFRRDRPPLHDPWGGIWIQLHSPRQAGPPIWLFQPERLASNVWFLPVLRSLALLIGLAVGSALFLRRRLEHPLTRMLEQLEDLPRPPLQLLPEVGVAPLRQLTFRINRLLENINDAQRARSSLLRGLAHDLASPQTRLMLHAESLRERLEGEEQRMVEAIENDLRQLAAITEQLNLLADETIPSRDHRAISLDDLCARVAGSYAAGVTVLQVPRLLTVLDGLGLERSLCNLIDNALEYGKPPIHLSAQRQRSRLLVRVEDHGPGLSSTTQLTMTTPPAADDRQRRRHRGMGLEIVDRFCRDHGGRLVLDRSPLGGLRATLQLESRPEAQLFLSSG